MGNVSLTPEGKVQLRQMVHDYLNARTDLARPPKTRNTYPKSVMLAFVPIGGIDPVEVDQTIGTGTGTASPYDEPGFADCAIYKITTLFGPKTIEPINKTVRVYNVSTTKIASGYVPIFRHQNGDWIAIPEVSNESVAGAIFGIQLAADHPGEDIAFDVWVGTWNTASDDWTYVTQGETAKAIDHRAGAPFPDAGARGLGVVRESDTYGTIYEVIDLDCTSAGTGT